MLGSGCAPIAHVSGTVSSYRKRIDDLSDPPPWSQVSNNYFHTSKATQSVLQASTDLHFPQTCFSTAVCEDCYEVSINIQQPYKCLMLPVVYISSIY